MEALRIGYDAKRLYRNFTGLGNYSRSLLAHLAQNYPQHHYHLYTTKISDHPLTQAFLNSTAFRTQVAPSIFKAYWRSHGVLKQLQSDQIDLYHGLSHEIPWRIADKGIKTVVSIHDLIFKIHPATYPWIDRQIYDWKFRFSCQMADRIIAISEHTKRDIVRLYQIDPSKIDVVYQSCAPLFYEASDVERQERRWRELKLPSEFLLYVGSIVERKNLKSLIQAYRLLPSSLQIPLVIVGKGKQYLNELMILVKRHQLANRVIWLAHLEDNRDLKILYQKARVFIYPSIYEGFGLPVAEALLCQCPVITSKGSAMTEAGGPGALYVDPFDVEDIAHKIQRVLEEEQVRQELMQKGYPYALKKFNGKTFADHTMAIYQKLMG